jgi:hypothetical protein
MDSIHSILSETLENYEIYRIKYTENDQIALVGLRQRLRAVFVGLLAELRVLRINAETNNGQFNNPPLLENFNVAFLENSHKISRGIYCGINFQREGNLFSIYLSTSITNKPNKQNWERIFIDKFKEMIDDFGWEIPFQDSNHNWRYISKTYNINNVEEDKVIRSILVGIMFVRLIINQNIELVREYLRKENIPKYGLESTLEILKTLKQK